MSQPLKSSAQCPTVLLRHDTPDPPGSWHIDWLIAREPDAASGLMTFRLDERPDELSSCTAVAATRIADHRAIYLTYEGPISANRGDVRRLRAGQCLWMRVGSDGMEIEVDWGDGRGSRYLIEPCGNADSHEWRIFRFPSATD